METVGGAVKRSGPWQVAQDSIGAQHVLDGTWSVVSLGQVLKDGTDCLKGLLRDSCRWLLLTVGFAWTALRSRCQTAIVESFHLTHNAIGDVRGKPIVLAQDTNLQNHASLRRARERVAIVDVVAGLFPLEAKTSETP